MGRGDLSLDPPLGPTGPEGPGVPDGGTTHQVLRKVNNSNQNTEWHTLGTAAESAATDFRNNAFTPTTSSDWDATIPDTVQKALDQIAARLRAIE
jgi:hypothetical protein